MTKNITRFVSGLGVLLVALMACPSVDAACTQQSAGELTAKLAWTNTDTVNTDTVNVLRSNTSGSEAVLLNVPYGTTYTDTVPPVTAASITYYYEVQAKGPGGVSVGSNEVCKTFFQGPPAPQSLTVQ